MYFVTLLYTVVKFQSILSRNREIPNQHFLFLRVSGPVNKFHSLVIFFRKLVNCYNVSWWRLVDNLGTWQSVVTPRGPTTKLVFCFWYVSHKKCSILLVKASDFVNYRIPIVSPVFVLTRKMYCSILNTNQQDV